MNEARTACRHLVVVHFHLRPGGVRRVVELTLPAIVRANPSVQRVSLVVGEGSSTWVESLRGALSPCPLAVVEDRCVGYFQEAGLGCDAMQERLRAVVGRVIEANDGTVVWVHNPGLGRNLLLVTELVRAARAVNATIICHHHDLWFENRWRRYAEMEACGFGDLDSIARAIFAADAKATHVFINGLDAGVGSRHLAPHTAWIPNPVSKMGAVSDELVGDARVWLRNELGDDSPVWIFPTRFLRRKNIAEAVLLTRWLRPGAWLLTTADVSSDEEREYADALEAAAKAGNWRVRFRVMPGSVSRRPKFDALVAAAEVLLMTSVQEGFGLPYFEAVAAAKPLVARALPNVAPDLRELGFRFSHLYDEVWIDPSLIDLAAERARQKRAWSAWRDGLPEEVCGCVESPDLLAGGDGAERPIAFSRLTLAAQFEVLAVSGAESWEICKRHNPDLVAWRALAGEGRLGVAQWPAAAEEALGVASYSRQFWMAVEEAGVVDGEAVETMQREFISHRLGARFQFPLLYGGSMDGREN